MTDETTPIIPENQIGKTTPPEQDLQIDLENISIPENSSNTPEKKEQTIEIENTSKNKESDLDLNFDINLEDVPKKEDRLKEEDRKNQEEENKNTKSTQVKIEANTKNKETKVSSIFPEATMPEIPTIEQNRTEDEKKATPENVAISKEEQTPEKKPENFSVVEEAPIIQKKPSTVIEEIPSALEKPIEENNRESETLQKDQEIINQLEKQSNVGGLDKEAKIDTKPTATEEKTETFDLDAMLWATVTPSVANSETTNDLFKVQPEQTPIVEQTQTIEQTPVVEQTTTPEPMTNPTQTPPPQIQNQSIYTTPQIQKPTQQKDKNVKILLFVVLFAVLWFISYFILKTMYPIEFGNMFNKNPIVETNEKDTEDGEEIENFADFENLEDIENSENEEKIEELTGVLEEIPEETTEENIPETGSNGHESADDFTFWELNELWNADGELELDDIGRLTDYVNKGIELREIGKELNNKTIIKFALYTKSKATSFLEKIAKGEEISNLDSYFAQFDQYITQMEELITTIPEDVSSFTQNNAEETTATQPETHPFLAE